MIAQLSGVFDDPDPGYDLMAQMAANGLQSPHPALCSPVCLFQADPIEAAYVRERITVPFNT